MFRIEKDHTLYFNLAEQDLIEIEVNLAEQDLIEMEVSQEEMDIEMETDPDPDHQGRKVSWERKSKKWKIN